MTAIIETEQGPRQVKIVKMGMFKADVDVNHPLAGKTLTFELKVVSVRAASAEEVAHGHAHGVGGHHHH
jgi:FKBP-type peptidyl-prolyl cis-trans isomerase SlyD